MNGVTRFFSLGAQDADRQVAAALAPEPFDHADRYLQTSAVVIALDRVMQRLQDAWFASAAWHWLSGARDFSRGPSHDRYPAVAWTLLTATFAHVGLILLQGPRPGWFWMAIPAMVALFAGLLLVASRPSHSAN